MSYRLCGVSEPHEPHRFLRRVDHAPGVSADYVETCPGIQSQPPVRAPGTGTTLAEAWEDGAAASAEYVRACCGCVGKGEPPSNPYEEEKNEVGTGELGQASPLS